MIARPTILQVLPRLGTGGIERGTIEIARAIVQSGGRALVAAGPGRLLPALLATGAEHIPLDLGGKSPFAIMRNARRLREVIARHDVDLVHARSRAPAWAARLATRRAGIPMVTTWHGLHSASWWGKKRYNSVLAQADRVIAISGFIAERLTRDYAVPPERLRLIARGADLVAFDPARVAGPRLQALATAWGLPDGARVIVLPGRITPGKGQMELIEALALLERMAPDLSWTCVFVGPAEAQARFTQDLTRRAAALRLGERLRFSGVCADMPAALALADVVVVPSLRPEPFGRVVVEAQAMGRPVIVADHGASAEIVTHGQTGLLVRPGDAQALAQAINDVLQADPASLGWLAERARARVAERFGMHAMQAQTLRVYDELLGTDLAVRFPDEQVPGGVRMPVARRAAGVSPIGA